MERVEPYCIGIQGNATFNFEMSYRILGKSKNKIQYDLYDPNNNIIKTGTGEKTAYFKEKIYQNGIYTICFTNLDKKPKKLNFDVLTSPDEGVQDVLETDDLIIVEWELKSIHESMERISHMINANTERTNQQVKIRREGKNNFAWWLYYKSFAIVVICGIKIYFMMKYFDIGEKARNFLGLSVGKNYV